MIPLFDNCSRVISGIISGGKFVSRCFLGLFAISISSTATMEYRHNAPESALDQRYLYHWKILENRLGKNRGKIRAL